MEYWIVYDLATGEELYTGSGMPGTAAYQQAPEGTGIIMVPQAVVAQQPRNLGALKAALVVGVDNEAERVRGNFITALPGQVGGYMLKADAARAWLLDNEDQDAIEELSYEATAADMTIGELVAEVLANAKAWRMANGAIEGLRRGAKRRILAATTIGAIVQAAVIDWSVLDASAA